VTAVPAGWYPDPSGQFETRYWDGTAWTHHTARPVNSPAAEAASSAPNQRIDHASAGATHNATTADRGARSAPVDRVTAPSRARPRRPASATVASGSDHTANRQASAVAARGFNRATSMRTTPRASPVRRHDPGRHASPTSTVTRCAMPSSSTKFSARLWHCDRQNADRSARHAQHDGHPIDVAHS